LGSLAVENFVNSKKMSDEDFYQEIFKTDQSVPFAVATYHPSTKILEDDKKIVMNIIKSVTSKKIHLLFTFPNADLNNAHIIKVLIKESKKNKFLTVKKNLGGLLYNSALKKSIFMVGNSSSGIIESSACKTPSINIGSRQDGRDMNLNTVNVSGTELSISKAIKKIADSSFLEQAFTKDIYFKKNAVSFLSKKLIKLINS